LDNKALLVIDGVISDNSFDDTNVGDIDNVVVLKGAEATAIYGAKAVNGVILSLQKNIYYAIAKRKKKNSRCN
jgi:TonB-dependent SusC/RagA subfamily outer membrane receptor